VSDEKLEKMNTLLSAIFNCNRINHQTNTFLIKLFKNHRFAQQKKMQNFCKKKKIAKFWFI